MTKETLRMSTGLLKGQRGGGGVVHHLKRFDLLNWFTNDVVKAFQSVTLSYKVRRTNRIGETYLLVEAYQWIRQHIAT